jgi:hypothetical protein
MTTFVQKVTVARFLLQEMNLHYMQTGHYPVRFQLSNNLYRQLLAEIPCYLSVHKGKVFLSGVQIVRDGLITYPIMIDHHEEEHYI